MPGVSHRGPVSGALGVGKVHLTFKPTKIRSRYGFYIYCIGLCILLFAISWSNPYYKNKFNLPLVRKIFVVYNDYTDSSLNLGNMDLISDNINANISITRDNNGVPYIHGEDMYDTVFGQGYMHACDRWIQMDFSRRKALGTLNELFGDDALNSDNIAKSLNIKHLAENDIKLLTPTENKILQAYTNGVNTYLSQLSNRLPYHYSIINTNISTIEPWDIKHTLALLRMYAYEYSHGWEDDLINFIFNLSNVKIDSINNMNTNIKSNNIISSTSGSSWIIAGKHRSRTKNQQKNSAYMGINFNSYVHKDNNWYINSLKSDKLNVVGSSIPGIPLMFMGHNGNIAWGYSISSNSNENLYINNKLYKNENDLSTYDIIDQEETCQINEKFISLEHIIPVNIISHIKSKSYNLSFESNSLKSVTPPITIENLLNLNQANDWSTFSNTLQQMNNVALQYSYIDINGNIGYFDTTKNNIYNPLDGYIVIDDTFDNKINGNSYINFLIHSYHQSDNDSLNVNNDNMLKLFSDTFSSSSIKLCNIVQLLKGNADVHDDLKIFDIIDQFDGYYSSTSKLPLFLEIFRLELRNKFLKLITNKFNIESYLSGQSFLSSFNQKSKYYYKNNLNWLIDIILSSNNDNLFKTVNGRMSFLLDTYNQTIRRCYKKYGTNINNWPTWSDVHQGLLQQSYSDHYSLFIKSLISHGPSTIAGGIDSVMNTWFDTDHSYSHHTRKTKIPSKPAKITSLRLVYDMHDLDNSLYSIPCTQSINYGSRWGDDIYYSSFYSWAQGNMNKNLCWSNECIAKNKHFEFKILKRNSL